MTRKEWPKYEMVVNGQRKFLTLGEAGAAYDSGHVPVSFGKLVMEDDSAKTRPMTDEDCSAISAAADAYSDSK